LAYPTTNISSWARRDAALLYGDELNSSTVVAPPYFLGAVTLRLRGARSDATPKKGVKNVAPPPPFSTEDDCSERVILTLPI
jgi:hypothetical protein